MTAAADKSPGRVLLIAGNPGEARAIAETFGRCRPPVEVHVAENRAEAMGHLGPRAEAATGVAFDLVILDAGMAAEQDQSVLVEIKREPRLRTVPVIVLANESAGGRAGGVYGLGANCCVVKPSDPGMWGTTVELIHDFWFTVVQLSRE
jgi:CheY-like chemotaxis protein